MEGNFEGRGKKDLEALGDPVNRPDNAQMHALSAKDEQLRSLFRVRDGNV